MTISAPPHANRSAPILVLVHPGSACGSANYNIGRADAKCGREALALALDEHAGGVIVIDGALSDELPDYPDFNGAIDQALARARSNGLTSMRVMGCDSENFDQTRAIAAVLEDHPALKDHEFIVTGAWYEAPTADDAEPGGCVGSVLTALATLGARARVDESALEMEIA
ncbi:MAG: hypothetical protein O9327_02055 [Polaromonas sp.]|nr:hypothetical protein [Polaromonas sp.]